MYFLPRGGVIYCGDCMQPSAEPAVKLSRGALTGLRHTIYADFEKLFSFSLSPRGLSELSRASEQYMLATLQRGFNTLDFYHQIAQEDPLEPGRG